MEQPARSTLSLREIWFLLEPAAFFALGCAPVMWGGQLHELLTRVPTSWWWALLWLAAVLDGRVHAIHAGRRRRCPGSYCHAWTVHTRRSEHC